MPRRLDRFEAGFNRAMVFLAALVAVSIGLFAVLIPLNLFLVKTHLGSMWWLYEAVEYALYFGVFIGTPWVLQQGAHVRVDILSSALSKAAAARLEQGLDVAGAALCGLLCFYGVRVTISEFQDGMRACADFESRSAIAGRRRRCPRAKCGNHPGSIR